MDVHWPILTVWGSQPQISHELRVAQLPWVLDFFRHPTLCESYPYLSARKRTLWHCIHQVLLRLMVALPVRIPRLMWLLSWNICQIRKQPLHQVPAHLPKARQVGQLMIQIFGYLVKQRRSSLRRRLWSPVWGVGAPWYQQWCCWVFLDSC